jgi:hypothetical protein
LILARSARAPASFHPRYFAFFDLDRSLLIETYRVKDARSSSPSRQRRGHRAPSPLLIERAAGGHGNGFAAHMQRSTPMTRTPNSATATMRACALAANA